MPIVPEMPTLPRELTRAGFNFDRTVRTEGGLENGKTTLSTGHFKHSWSPKQRQVLHGRQAFVQLSARTQLRQRINRRN
jgi:hypothetical protein